MCKKLILVLAMLAIVVPASAATPGHWTDGDWTGGNQDILRVDIDASGTDDANDLQPGWNSWEMGAYWGPLTKESKIFDTPLGPMLATLDGITKTGGNDNLGGSRDRIDNEGATNDNDFAKMLSDLAYVAQTADGMGKDYMELSVTFGSDYAGWEMLITTWSWDIAFNGSGYGGGAGEQEDTKWVAWSTSNPSDWLDDNGYDPNGYAYTSGPPYSSSMPAGLMALVGGYALQQGTAPWLTDTDNSYGMTFAATTKVTLDSNGRAVIYGWQDGWSITGSHHIALNGFDIQLPEPATIALLGLGGLTLLQKRRYKKA